MRTSVKRDFPQLYNSWRGMRERCNRSARPDAHCYAAKGITICPEWEDFHAFKAWALANGFAPGLTIERQKSDQGYSPANCIWADRKTQARNISRNRRIDFNGMSLCLSEWAEKTGIAATNILARIDRLGWTVEAALTVPVGAIPTGPKSKGRA